jgi:circadian clock protein KaiB
MGTQILVIDDSEEVRKSFVLALEDTVRCKSDGKFIFKLFVAGKTPRAEKIGQLVRSFLDDALKGQYDLSIFDVMQNPSAADDENVFATPTLIKILPEPSKRIMGDLTNKERVLVHLGITGMASVDTDI